MGSSAGRLRHELCAADLTRFVCGGLWCREQLQGSVTALRSEEQRLSTSNIELSSNVDQLEVQRCMRSIIVTLSRQPTAAMTLLVLMVLVFSACE